MTSAADELLAAVERSPEMAGAHDRDGWIGLFTDDGRIEDPYGSRPHVGRAQIERFYDTFIGPRQVVFHRDLDVVSGNSVLRDLTLEVRMGSGLTLMTPIVIRYDLRAGDAGWRISRLRAYWELPAMIRQFASNGVGALPVSARLATSLLRNQGVGGTLGFAAGFRGVGARGKRLVGDYLAQRNISSDKVIAAGDTVAVSGVSPSGRTILLAEIAPGGSRIERVEHFDG